MLSFVFMSQSILFFLKLSGVPKQEKADAAGGMLVAPGSPGSHPWPVMGSVSPHPACSGLIRSWCSSDTHSLHRLLAIGAAAEQTKGL